MSATCFPISDHKYALAEVSLVVILYTHTLTKEIKKLSLSSYTLLFRKC